MRGAVWGHVHVHVHVHVMYVCMYVTPGGRGGADTDTDTAARRATLHTARRGSRMVMNDGLDVPRDGRRARRRTKARLRAYRLLYYNPLRR